MNRITFVILLLLALCVPAVAQKKERNHGEMRRELQEFKIKYLAQEMELRDDQQKQFVEVYSRMSEEKRAIFREKRRLEKHLKENASATDAEYAAVGRALRDVDEKNLAVDRKYDAQFAKFLTQKQIYKMKEAEEKFRSKMREMRHKSKKK